MGEKHSNGDYGGPLYLNVPAFGVTFWSIVIGETIVITSPAPACHVSLLPVQADCICGQTDWQNGGLDTKRDSFHQLYQSQI